MTLNCPARKNALGAVILTGAGGDFSAGGDLSPMSDLTPAAARRRLLETHRWLEELMNLDRPVIAAVDGAAFGAGFGLALTADFVIASPRIGRGSAWPSRAMSTDYFREAVARFGRKQPPLLRWPAVPRDGD